MSESHAVRFNRAVAAVWDRLDLEAQALERLIEERADPRAAAAAAAVRLTGRTLRATTAFEGIAEGALVHMLSVRGDNVVAMVNGRQRLIPVDVALQRFTCPHPQDNSLLSPERRAENAPLDQTVSPPPCRLRAQSSASEAENVPDDWKMVAVYNGRALVVRPDGTLASVPEACFQSQKRTSFHKLYYGRLERTCKEAYEDKRALKKRLLSISLDLHKTGVSVVNWSGSGYTKKVRGVASLAISACDTEHVAACIKVHDQTGDVYFAPLCITKTASVEIDLLGTNLQANGHVTKAAAGNLIDRIPEANFFRSVALTHVHQTIRGDYTHLGKLGKTSPKTVNKIKDLSEVLKAAGCGIVPIIMPVTPPQDDLLPAKRKQGLSQQQGSSRKSSKSIRI